MLIYEIQSRELHNKDAQMISEALQGVYTNKTAYHDAVSLCRFYSRFYDCECAVIAHDENDWNNSAFTLFYSLPHMKRYATAHKDACNFRR